MDIGNTPNAKDYGSNLERAGFRILGQGETFSASQNALQLVLSTINSARLNIDVAAYSFTSKPVAAALVAAKNRGVAVRVVADEIVTTANTPPLRSLQTRACRCVLMAGTPSCTINLWLWMATRCKPDHLTTRPAP
ncbi:phospholipase D-like domain-containing protein [Enterobacter roggenkampii]|nr:phospholipase D-like domain-containing protein [Enterobacter roggenkampii]